MKIDMHCHVKEGSIDSKVPLETAIAILQQKGFQGMVLTDHNSYKGYRFWKKHLQGEISDFVVLKGIEYDTIDAGHMLVIMPESMHLWILEMRGLPVMSLVELVHKHGGVIGPAHPCGEKFLSFVHTRRYRKMPDIIAKFDFVESFNSCEKAGSNQAAAALAEKYGKITIGGSDAHKEESVGLGYTILPEPILTESALIALIRKGKGFHTGGTLYTQTTRDRMGKIGELLKYSYWLYNKGGALLRRPGRKIEKPVEIKDFPKSEDQNV